MNWSTASGRNELVLRLRQIGSFPDAELDLGEAALLLAALDRPRVPLERYFQHLGDLQAAAGRAIESTDDAAPLSARVEALRQVIAGEFNYVGDELTYDDLQNANLMRVIDRRKGLPVALGILYLTAARGQGWTIDGLNFPGHFLLRLEHDGERLVLDPFNGGATCDTAEMRRLLKTATGEDAELAPEHYEPVGNRAILLRLQNNIKLRLLQRNDAQGALEALESMLMLAPDEADLWREVGLLHLAQENLRAAVMALEHFLELSRDPRDHATIAEVLSQLRTRLH